MEHLVRFSTAEGRDGHHYAASLEEALHFVERLRNNEQANDVRVYRLKELGIEFRTYYKVEVRGEAEAAAEALVPAADLATPQPVPAEGPATVGHFAAVGADGDGNGSRRLFSRG